jgi:cytoskeletal protein RodZ
MAMVVLGIILVVVAVLVGLGVGIASSSSASIEGFGMEVETTAALVYFAGAVTAIVLLAGLWLMKKGTARTYRRRKEVKTLRRQVATSPAEDESADLQGRHVADEDVTARTSEPAPADATSAEAGSAEDRPAEDTRTDGGRPATTR